MPTRSSTAENVTGTVTVSPGRACTVPTVTVAVGAAETAVMPTACKTSTTQSKMPKSLRFIRVIPFIHRFCPHYTNKF